MLVAGQLGSWSNCERGQRLCSVAFHGFDGLEGGGLGVPDWLLFSQQAIQLGSLSSYLFALSPGRVGNDDRGRGRCCVV